VQRAEQIYTNNFIFFKSSLSHSIVMSDTNEFDSVESINSDPSEESNESGELLRSCKSALSTVGGDGHGELLARQQPETTQREVFGWVMYDWAHSVFYNSVANSFLPVFILTVATNNEADDHKFAAFPGIRVSGANFFPSVAPVQIVFQILALILFGSVGDFGGARKRMLVGCSIVGSVSTALLAAANDDTYSIAIVFMILAQVALTLSLVSYNSYLPLLVANLPDVRHHRGEPDFDKFEIKAANKISTQGVALGYVAGLLLLGINVAVGVGTPGSCHKWCAGCPSLEGNATMPGWRAYEYEIRNGTLETIGVFCPSGPCYAWPGLNPPCGTGAVGDIVDGQCVATSAWPMYEYTASGVRWRANASVDVVEAAMVASALNTTHLCTLPPLLLADNLTSDGVDATLGPLALAANNGNTGCPHFRCARSDCNRLYDPTVCDSEHVGLRGNLFSAGLWWFVFAIPTYLYVQPRSAPPLPPGMSYWRASYRRIKSTFAKIRQLRNTFLFLIAYWVANDAGGTIAYGAGLLASQAPLFFSSSDLGLLLLLINVVGLIGALLYELLARFLTTQWRKRKIASGVPEAELDSYWVCKFILFINLAFAFMLPIWAMPGVGLTTKVEFFIVGGIYGFQLGSLSSFSRVLLQHFTPAGCESEFFAFLELTGRGTSWLGPILLTVIGEKTGSNRWALASVSTLFIVAMILLAFIDTKQGHIDAQNFHISQVNREHEADSEELTDDAEAHAEENNRKRN
jgi:MFS-type transporter involved in bile tolerance (Atg22 family)